MSTPPGAAPPQYSPDGRWFWDGARWLPVQPPAAAAPPPRGGMPVWGWIAIGCGGLLLLALVALGAAAVFTFRSLQAAGCPPSDFPLPAASHQAGVYVNSSPGQSTCDVTWNSDTPPAAVDDFYQRALRSGDWQIVAVDPASGRISFQRVSRATVTGEVELLGHGQQTTIQIHLLSGDGRFSR